MSLTPQELWIDARARDICEEAGMPQGAYELFIPDASKEYVARIIDMQKAKRIEATATDTQNQ